MMPHISVLGVLLPLFCLTAAAMPGPTAAPAAALVAAPAPTTAPTPTPIYVAGTLALSAEAIEALAVPGDSRVKRQMQPGFSKRQTSLVTLCGSDFVSCGTGDASGFCCEAEHTCYLDVSTYRCQRNSNLPDSASINSLISSYNNLVSQYATKYTGISMSTLAPYNSLYSVNYSDYISSYMALLLQASKVSTSTNQNGQFQTFTAALPTLFQSSMSVSAAMNTNPANNNDDDKRPITVGQIIGIVIAAILAIAVIAAVAVWLLLRNRRQRVKGSSPPGATDYQGAGLYQTPPGYSQVTNPQYGIGYQGGQHGGYSADGKVYYDPQQQSYPQQQQQQQQSVVMELGGNEIVGAAKPAHRYAPTAFAAELDGGLPPHTRQ